MKLKFKISLLVVLLSWLYSNSQIQMKPGDLSDPQLPQFARLMYASNPNYWEVTKAFEAFRMQKDFKETYHTAYYKHWSRWAKPFVNDNGEIVKYGSANTSVRSNNKSGNITSGSNWNYAGPDRHFKVRYDATDPVKEVSWHANMYCIDQSATNTNVLYAGGENGGIYKSIDKGLNWQYISRTYDMVSVSAIAVSPFDENLVIATADNATYRTLDGGNTWSLANTSLGSVNVWQILFDPVLSNVVFAATADGLYRSVDGGINFSNIFAGECQSVAFKPDDHNVVYALQYSSVSKIASFYKSINNGTSFSIKPNGWFQVPAVDAGLIQSYGGRIATTSADNDRVYVLLVGESQSSAQLQLQGQIGIYKSNDAGESWSLPHGTIGAPYNANTHPNMMTFSGDNNTYTQIYYNTALAVSQLNADELLVGGLSMWRSTDAGVSYDPVGGYVGSVDYIHPDIQEFKVYKTSPSTQEIWWASDGGINYSTDFVQTHAARSAGLLGVACWGFDQGWNDDIMVGGRYHNGNAGRRDGYPGAAFQQLGGGEAPTGYVNYSNEQKTYYSDIDGIILADTLNGLSSRFPIAEDPNESYVDNSSSRMVFDWDYWNVVYMGQENKILISTNGGSSYGVLFVFGNTPSNSILWIEQSRSNPNVIYAQQIVNNVSILWKSSDRGNSWNQVPLPLSRRQMNFTLSGSSSNELWVSYPTAPNGNKIYKTINGGSQWINLTTADLNGYEIDAICHQYGTDGGIYLATYHGPVFYRNNGMANWQVLGTDIPAIAYPLRVVPFYRDQKLRLATWHLGIWEHPLYEASDLIADFSANYSQFYCPGDTIKFVPHAVTQGAATYNWIFTGGTPANSTAMYPQVVYTSVGSYDVTLIVTENGMADTITKTAFIGNVPASNNLIVENFETGIFDNSWKAVGNGISASNWTVYGNASGFGTGTYAMAYDNWTYDALGSSDAIWLGKQNFQAVQLSKLYFDVAYARYSSAYSDTLEIKYSTDCGSTFTSIYKKGGTALATAPQNSTAPFVPTPTQWRTDSINISALSGSSEIIFSFENIGYFGQVLYVDNINLASTNTGLQSTIEKNKLVAFPNPATHSFTLTGHAPLGEIQIVDATGKLIDNFTTNLNATEVNCSTWSSGVYFVQANGKQSQVVKFIKQ